MRTLEEPIRGSVLGIHNLQSTESEHISLSGNKVGLEIYCRHSNSHNQFPNNFNNQFNQYMHTPNSN